MLSLLLALLFFAFLDSLDVLLVGVTTAVIFDSKLGRRSPVPGGLSFLAGVFAVTTTFGICTVLGLSFLTDLVGFRVTPAIRYWGELGIGIALVVLAALPATAKGATPPWVPAIRRKPWALALAGVAIGLGQAPTAVPYLAGLAMLSAQHPIPAFWPVIVVVYCALALIPPLAVLALASRRTPGAQRFYRRVVRALARYGPVTLRILFAAIGIGLVVDAALHYRQLT
ncbi:GAP family protein [Nocardia sp. 2]|uniref:GAP family protein n=1 Tax=Nocardia acididurans TaxID=2802282 RepID=A0ABS1ME82_9NOCA|nr:GAP family protein [Nocardia acididurans]MBL1078917.1 GAP family protein [Nocardia acididurans]